MSNVNWSDLRNEYVTTNISYRQMAKKHGIGASAIYEHGRKGDWVSQREQFRSKRNAEIEERVVQNDAKQFDKLVRVTDKAIAKIERMIESCNDEQGMRALIASLKDIKNIQGARSDAEMREQEARIDNLRKSADKNESAAQEINVKLNVEKEWCE